MLQNGDTVVIVEKRGLIEPVPEGFQCKGCNFCAGGISPRLDEILRENGLVVPEEIIQGRIEYGSKQLAIEHTALVPKGRFLTVAIIGDAVGARLNKDGLFSAHLTASRLAWTVLHDRIGQQALAKAYGKAIQWLAADNRFGRMVFGVSRVAFTKPVVSRITYQAYATECKVRDERSRPLSVVLWKIASGTADYREVLREMCGYGVLRSILAGAAVTLRNVAFEALFGLKWGEYGRYPTVVLKEKREVLKEQLASSLGMELGEAPEFERMYVIKIRGAAEEIMAELAQFGDPNARFLDLRFIEVRRIEGLPNQAGSVIRYKVPLVGLAAELRLTRRIGSETLLYQFDERLADHGKLIFNVAPARDGNSRLSIYASFDYKKGSGFAGRVLWKGFKLLFPEFVHDIVWNHALCTIKEEVERKHSSSPAPLSR